MNSESIEDTCLGLLKKLNILSLQPWYIFSVLIFVTKNRNLFKSNLEIHGINPDTILIYIPPSSSVTVFRKKELYILESRFFNHLPSSVKKFVSWRETI